MILHLSDDAHNYEPVNLGQENTFDITSAYTKNNVLFISLEMIRSTGERAHSNRVFFEIRGFSGDGDTSPEVIPPPVNTVDKLYGEAWLEGDKLVLGNLSGELLKEITLPNTGGGSGGYDGSFTLDVEDGNLYFITDSGAENPFEYDEATGNLYYKEG